MTWLDTLYVLGTLALGIGLALGMAAVERYARWRREFRFVGRRRP
jgi:hypothetical protein